MTSGESVYTGRFAPSPTGPLHFGSLVAALASFLDARHANGRWLLRIEDLDPPRESKAAPAIIMAQLKACELHWDDDVLYQSSRIEAFEEALLRLDGLTYPCTCSRSSVSGVYSGRCRGNQFEDTQAPYAIRIRTEEAVVTISDRIAGQQTWHLERDVGDFIIKRRDGLFAYQLAVVVDDAFQGVTDVVRGNDLLDSTPKQVYLRRCLGYPEVAYCHVPVIVDDRGQKFSKQNRAAPIASGQALPVLRKALLALGQPTFPEVSTVPELVESAIKAWNPAAIPHTRNVRYAGL